MLDMTAAQSTSVATAATASDVRLSARQKANKRRSYGGRTAATAAIHGLGRSSIASVGAGLYKSFRERFGGGVGDYRALRQRDAEAGNIQKELASSDSSDEESLQSSGSDGDSSSAEDIFTAKPEPRQARRKKPEPRARRRRRRRVSA